MLKLKLGLHYQPRHVNIDIQTAQSHIVSIYCMSTSHMSHFLHSPLLRTHPNAFAPSVSSLGLISLYISSMHRRNNHIYSNYIIKSALSHLKLSSNVTSKSLTISPRISLLLEITSQPGALHEVLKYFWKYDMNLTHIESRPVKKGDDSFHIYLDFEGGHVNDGAIHLIDELRGFHRVKSLLLLGEKEVPWFPRCLSDLDIIANRTLDASDLHSDHPGFNDPKYRKRREILTQNARNYRFGEPLPYINYLPEEISTWMHVYKHLETSHKKYACEEYLRILKTMEQECYGIYYVVSSNERLLFGVEFCYILYLVH